MIDPILKEWFDVFNDNFFDGYLDTPDFLCFYHPDQFADEETRDASRGVVGWMVHYPSMQFDIMIAMDQMNHAHTLIHEMIHLWQWETGRKMNHGKSFQKKCLEIMEWI